MLKEYLERVIEEQSLEEPRDSVGIDEFITSSSFAFLRDVAEYQLSLHDSRIKHFSQKRNGNEYDVSLTFNAFVYQDGIEHGYQDFTLKFNTRTNLRCLTHKAMYHFALWNPVREMGFVYVEGHRLKSISFEFTNLSKHFGKQKFHK